MTRLNIPRVSYSASFSTRFNGPDMKYWSRNAAGGDLIFERIYAGVLYVNTLLHFG